MPFIYVLKLGEGKYYVGRTNDSERRASEHYFKDSCSSWWVKKYGYVEMIENVKGEVWDEDKWVIKYMSWYGIDNVRGGSFSQMEIEESERKVIEKMIRNASDKCFGCGERGHFIRFCPNKEKKEDISEQLLCMDLKEKESVDTYVCLCGDEFLVEDSYKKHTIGCLMNGLNITQSEDLEDKCNICIRCGRWGHSIERCYAKSDKDGNRLN